MIARWIARLQQAFAPIAPVDACAWQALLASSALFAGLDESDRATLRGLAERFLARKRFSAAAGHELTCSQCLTIAALACLPVLHLGHACLEGWHEIIVYPGGFRVRRENHGEHSGAVTECDCDLIGEA